MMGGVADNKGAIISRVPKYNINYHISPTLLTFRLRFIILKMQEGLISYGHMNILVIRHSMHIISSDSWKLTAVALLGEDFLYKYP
jgi:hypothetical protein